MDPSHYYANNGHGGHDKRASKPTVHPTRGSLSNEPTNRVKRHNRPFDLYGRLPYGSIGIKGTIWWIGVVHNSLRLNCSDYYDKVTNGP